MSETLGRIDFAAKRKIVTVDVPELEGSINIRALSVRQMESIKDDAFNTAKQLALAIVDDHGQPIYSTSDEDIANLMEMSVTVRETLLTALNALHGLTPERIEDIKKKSIPSLNIESASA